LGRRSTNHP
jgi:hypothetical protein